MDSDRRRRALDAQRQARAREAETPEETQERRAVAAERQARARAEETAVQVQQRRELDAQRQARARKQESAEESQLRRDMDAQRQARAREQESAEESQLRRDMDAQRQARVREQESAEESQLRRDMDAQRQAEARREESVEEAVRRRNTNAERMAAARFRKIEHFVRAGLNYSPHVDYAASIAVSVGDMDVKCRYCDALKFKGEAIGMCCIGGKVHLERLPQPPPFLEMLLFTQSDISKMFWKYIRKYNSMFQMTSFGADTIDLGQGFMPTCRIQGQVYHRIGSLLPQVGQEAKYLQIYFTDNKDEEIERRMNALGMDQTHREIVVELQNMLDERNHLVRQFKSKFRALEPSHRLRICADKTPPNEHDRRYNAPITSEVAIILAGDTTSNRDIVIEQRDGRLKRIAETNP
ncbi:hypothetical protein AaE_001552, partial [Aphanomyces astaci]